jgi:hypothetical protein
VDFNRENAGGDQITIPYLPDDALVAAAVGPLFPGEA